MTSRCSPRAPIASVLQEAASEQQEAWASTRAFEPPPPKSSSSQLSVPKVAGEDKTDWKEAEIIGKDVRKRVLRAGSADEHGRPSAGAIVTLHYVGKSINGKETFLSTREVITPPGQSLTMRECMSAVPPGPYTFVLGEGSVVEAWEKAVPTMLPGEKCEVLAGPAAAYGEGGAVHLGVPPNATVLFELELLRWREAREPREGMEAAQRLERATALKARGTDAFKEEKWRPAQQLYDDAAYYLSDGYFASEAAAAVTRQSLGRTDEDAQAGPMKPLFGSQDDEGKLLLIACLLNASQCALRAEEWREAEVRASRALLLDKKNVKALFRRGTARTRMGDYADARADLRKANELDPKNKEVRMMFEECKMAEAADRDASKAFYANARAATGGYEAPPEAAPEPQFIC